MSTPLLFAENDIRHDLLNLSDKAESFLKEKPVLRIGNETDWPPYDYVEEGTPAGISVEFMEIIARIMGFEIEWVNGYTWEELLSMLARKEIDLIPNAARTAERERYISFTDPIFRMNMGVVIRSDFQIDALFLDLSGLTVASVPAYAGVDAALNSFTDVTVVEVTTPLEGIKAVQDGRIDAYIDDSSVNAYYLSHYFEDDLMVRPLFRTPTSGQSFNLSIGLRDDWAFLTEAFNSAISFVYEQEYHSILEEYIGSESILSHGFIISKTDLFTHEEVLWLSGNREIPLFFMDDLAPVSFFDRGVPGGIVRGYLDEIEKRLGIDFIYQGDGIPLSTGMEKLLSGDVSLIPSLTDTRDRRRRGMIFSDSYIDLPIEIYVNKKNAYVNSLSMREGLKVTAIEGYAVNEWIHRDFPEIELISVSSVEKGLAMLNRGRTDIYLGDQMTTNRALMENHFNNVIHVGDTPYSYSLGMGFNSRDVLLRSILNKAVKSVREEKGPAIETKWISHNVKSKMNPLVYIIAASLFLIVLLIIFFQWYTFRLKKNLLTRYAITDPLTGLYNRRYLDEIYETEYRRCMRRRNYFVFMIFDIDNFKKYNDSYGHSMGDSALKQVAQSFNKVFKRAGDYIFRLGGEEFAVLTTVEEKSEAVILADNFREYIVDQKILHEGNPPLQTLTLSGGIVVYKPGEYISLDHNYQAADQNLYKAKRNGRNRIEA